MLILEIVGITSGAIVCAALTVATRRKPSMPRLMLLVLLAIFLTEFGVVPYANGAVAPLVVLACFTFLLCMHRRDWRERQRSIAEWSPDGDLQRGGSVKERRG